MPAIVVTSSADRSSIGMPSGASVDRPVDRRRGRRDVERNAAVARRQRLQVRADLVDHVAGRRRPVGADEDDVDLAPLHQVPARVVDDHRVRDAVRAQLPRGQRRALVARARLVDPHVNRNTRVVRRVDARQRRAPVDRREPARVAMGQDLDRSLSPFARTSSIRRRACPPIARLMRDVLLGDRVGGGARRGRARAPAASGASAVLQRVERPAQVDRRGPRRQQRRARRLQRGVRGVLVASPARSRTPPPRRSAARPAPASSRSRSRPRRRCAAAA